MILNKKDKLEYLKNLKNESCDYLDLDFKYNIIKMVIENDIRYYKDNLKEKLGFDDMDNGEMELNILIDLFKIDRNDNFNNIKNLLEELDLIRYEVKNIE